MAPRGIVVGMVFVDMASVVQPPVSMGVDTAAAALAGMAAPVAGKVAVLAGMVA